MSFHYFRCTIYLYTWYEMYKFLLLTLFMLYIKIVYSEAWILKKKKWMWWHCIPRSQNGRDEAGRTFGLAMRCFVPRPESDGERSTGSFVVVSVVVEFVLEWKLLFVLVIAWPGPQFAIQVSRACCGWLVFTWQKSRQQFTLVRGNPSTSLMWAVVLPRIISAIFLLQTMVYTTI